MKALLDAQLSESAVKTHLGSVHEKGPPEPWISALSDRPTQARVRDYGLRWGTEALFSDFKSRGFGIPQTQLKQAERMERLLLVLTLALYQAVSTDMRPSEKPPKYTPKKPPAA